MEHIGIDLDGTIAGRNINAFAKACSEQFHFQLEEGPVTYRTLMRHPVMCQQAQTTQFEQALQRIEQAPAMLLAAPLLSGAHEGVSKLTKYGSIGYYTVRKAYPPYTPEQIEQTTKTWLHDHQFPEPEQVTFCMSLMNKLMQVYAYLRKYPGRFLLIDDLALKILECYEYLQAGNHPVLSREACQQVVDVLRPSLILVAFGSSSLAINSEIPFYTLEHWDGVDELIDCVFFH